MHRCTHHFSTAYTWYPESSIRSVTISNRYLRPIQRSPSVTSACSLFQMPDASPDLSTEVATESERERTPDNRAVVGLVRGERVGGTESDGEGTYGGERTVGIKRRGPAMVIFDSQPQSSLNVTSV